MEQQTQRDPTEDNQQHIGESKKLNFIPLAGVTLVVGILVVSIIFLTTKNRETEKSLSAEPSIMVNIVERNDERFIEWESRNAPDGSRVALTVAWTHDGIFSGAGSDIDGVYPPTGSYKWEDKREGYYRATAYLIGVNTPLPFRRSNTEFILTSSTSETYEISLPGGIERWIKIIYPNSGEELNTGEEYTITWESAGIDEQEEVSIWYERHERLWEIGTFENTGSITVYAPNTLPGLLCSEADLLGSEPGTVFSNEYYISIRVPQDNGTILEIDNSDVPVTLTGPCTDS